MANGITKLIIGAGIAAAIVGFGPVKPAHKADDDVAFLERLASTVERAKALGPDTRGYVSQVASSYKTPLSDAELSLRRQKALARIVAVVRSTGVNELESTGQGHYRVSRTSTQPEPR
jgi:hypothetical protein